MKKQIIIILIIVLLLVAGGSAYYFFIYDNNNNNSIIKEFPSDAVCDLTYLDFCYNKSSPAYGCNMETQSCDSDEFELATIIGVMAKNNIKIYGTTWCPHCKDQLNYFKEYKDYMIESGLFVYCDVEPIDPECNDIESVPTWKQKGEIVQIGVIDIDQLIQNIDSSLNIQYN